jgi:signal peptidase I
VTINKTMKIFGPPSSSIFGMLSLAFLAGVWLLFAPVQLAGQATYVIVSGISMEPNFHLGDLAIVRQAETYQIGDIVTYQNAELGKPVIHRIIGKEQGHFILKGDNNSWIDSYQPTQDEIIGKLWIFVPTIGKAIEWTRTPINMALVIAIMGGVLMSSTLTDQPKRGKNAKQPSASWGWLEMSLSALGVFLLVFLLIGILAFTRPTSRTLENASYQQAGIFFYSAVGTVGVYDSDTVHSGEPVFPKLTCQLNLGFAYNLAGDLAQDVSGTQQLSAKITDDQSGWQRTIPMKADTPFNGSSFSSSATLDLCQIESLVGSVEQETGFHPSTYTLNIIPHVAITGKIAGQDFHDTFEPHLVFKFDKLHFYLAQDNGQVDPLHFSKQSTLSGTEEEDNTFSLLGLQFRVVDLRLIAALGFCLSLVAALFVGISIYHTAQRSQDAFIRLRYGSLLVEVYERGLETLTPTIEVSSIDDLAKIAERQNAMILHMLRDSLHFYFVQSNATTYRYVVNDTKNGPAKTETARNKDF